MYANAVVDLVEDFDIVDFAQRFFSTEHQLLIVKEKGRKVHWHVHGTWIGDRKAYKEYPHPDRQGDGRSKTRPVRVAFDKDQTGFQYCCKEDPPNVVRQWHITDEQIADWHVASVAYNKDKDRGLKRAMEEVTDDEMPPKVLFRELKRACYTFLAEEGKILNPHKTRGHVLTHMWNTEKDQYEEFVLDQ